MIHRIRTFSIDYAIHYFMCSLNIALVLQHHTNLAFNIKVNLTSSDNQLLSTKIATDWIHPVL